ncbi:hypothetical protein HID58_043813 [Brassica napus]|uniref:Uncharacterized protein n=1 Tax=Brassica napus TaxID=3708 RepID=A0ABQ8BHK4_BRANA|nr:hypothetical protein HID58_043813 [Brassica napus]
MARRSGMARRLSRIEKEKKEFKMLRLSYEGGCFRGFSAICYSVIESSTSVTFRRLFSLTLGLFFGYCAVDIYILERKRSGRDLPKRKRKKPRRFMGQSVFARLGFGKRWRIRNCMHKDKWGFKRSQCRSLACRNCYFLEIARTNFTYCIDKWLFKYVCCPICRSLAVTTT